MKGQMYLGMDFLVLLRGALIAGEDYTGTKKDELSFKKGDFFLPINEEIESKDPNDYHRNYVQLLKGTEKLEGCVETFRLQSVTSSTTGKVMTDERFLEKKERSLLLKEFRDLYRDFKFVELWDLEEKGVGTCCVIGCMGVRFLICFFQNYSRISNFTEGLEKSDKMQKFAFTCFQHTLCLVNLGKVI